MKDLKKLLQQNRLYFCLFLVFLLLGSVCLYTFTKEDVTLWVNTHHSAFMDYFFWTMSFCGSFWGSLLVVVILWVWKSWRTSVNLIICIMTTNSIVMFLKHIIFPGTPRPTLYFDGVVDLRLLPWVEQLQTESFPSGHTAAAFSIATFLALFLSKKQYHGLLFLFALCVGYGRIYLSQHFITDVYTGMTIGVVITTLTYYVILQYNKGQ